MERRVAERAVEAVLDAEGVNPMVQARELAEKRLGQLGRLPAGTLQRRLLAYLGRRGFRGREVGEMVGELVREKGSRNREA